MSTVMTKEEINQEMKILSPDTDLSTFADLIYQETGGNREKVHQVITAVKGQLNIFRSSQNMALALNTYMGEA